MIFDFRQKLPVILQSESSECGDACLAMISAFYGYHISLLELRERFGPAPRGLSLLELVSRGAKLGLLGRGIRIDLDELTSIRAPCILHWNLNHFVVLNKVDLDSRGKAKSIEIHDPSRGRQKLNFSEFSKHFTGVVVEFSPATSFVKKPKARKIRLRDLIHSTVGLRKALVQVFLLAMALELASVLGPYFLQLVIDHALPNQDFDLLWSLAIGFGILTIVEVLLSGFRSWCVLTISSHLSVQWLRSLFNHLLQLPVFFFTRRTLGDIVSRFGSLRVIQKSLSGEFIEAVIDGILVMSMLLMMLVFSAELTLIALFFSLGYIFLRAATYSSFKQTTEEYTRLQAQEQTMFLESVRGIQAIKLHCHEVAQLSRWTSALVASTNRSTKGQVLAIFFNLSFKLLAGLEYILIISLSAAFVIGGSMTIGKVLAFLAFRGTFSSRFHVLIDKILEFRALSVHTERVADIALEQVEDVPVITNKSFELDEGEFCLELRGIWFRYSEHDPWILSGIDLRVEPGESLAIAGCSGAGKSTLLKIMLGLLKPTKGFIAVNGVPIDQIGFAAYRSQLGAVMQDDALFSGSLRDNISFFDTSPDEEEIVRACMSASIMDDIERMPMRLNTLVGDMGSSLSGGQYQRVLLARALYRKPKILFLDEATSHLDTARENKVNEAIKRLKITRITVAHREETLKCADRVVLLQSGRVDAREDHKLTETY